MVGLKTTTWIQRNKHQLTETKDYADSIGMKKPDVIDYGPGAMVSFFERALPSGIKSDWTISQKLMRSVARPIENALRKTGLFPLSSPEIGEVLETFRSLDPKSVYFVDIDERVLEIIEEAESPVNTVRAFQHDLTSSRFCLDGDIVLAYHVASRTNHPQISLRNIEASVKVGGLLSTTALGVDAESFVKRGLSLYQRIY